MFGKYSVTVNPLRTPSGAYYSFMPYLRWLEENNITLFKHNGFPRLATAPHPAMFWFTEETDAIAFKIRWA